MYRVTCHSCGKPFDAELAQECSCLQPVRSFRCTNCAACFCKAGKHALDAFWRDAPASLWRRRKAAVPGASPAEDPEPEDVTRPLVLFADDDGVARAIARKVISSIGISVIVADNGDAALDMARRYRPELIVTDALMPRLDGREMARIIKEELPQTKVVVITSIYKDPRYKHEAMKTFKVDDYLSKPVDPAALKAVVEKHLGIQTQTPW
jgi:CheY-like chemotaxis protein